IADLQREINAALNGMKAAVSDTRRLLEETCQVALTTLPCNLAWLLPIEEGAFVSRAIASEQGRSAGEVFLRLVAQGEQGLVSFPLVPDTNPFSKAAADLAPTVNVPLQQLRNMPGANGLFRAINQLRLSYVHFLPLRASGQIPGMMVLASKQAHDIG